MKTVFKQLTIIIYIIPVLITNVGCEMITYLEFNDNIKFSPKLSVTAILDSESGSLYVSLMEGRPLTDYNTEEPFYFFFEKIHDGEIRLYEDGTLIRSQQGTFDTATEAETTSDRYPVIQHVNYYVLTGFDVKPGSVYRLEVELEGYPVASSTITAPVAPVASASMDTSAFVIRTKPDQIFSMGYVWELSEAWADNIMPEKYWSVSVSIADPDPDNMNYYALDIFKTEHTDDNTISEYKKYNWGIGSYDAALLLGSSLQDLLNGVKPNDLSIFSTLLVNDFDFSAENASRTFYAGAADLSKNDNDSDSDEKITTHHSLSLRVTHVPSAVYRYYWSLAQNKNVLQLYSEPIIVVSNIENGYGIFSVLNSASITLLEWETYKYNKKEE